MLAYTEHALRITRLQVLATNFSTLHLLVRPSWHLVTKTTGAGVAGRMSGTPIDRSAADSAKGPRLQRLRASLFLVQAVTYEDNVQVYVAVEAEGDVVVTTATATESKVYSEEDKNYDEDGAFTFVSPSVINSVVIFADQWITWKYSKKVRLGLYTTVEIGKEKVAGRVKDLNLQLPSKPIIELLRANDFTDLALLPCVKALALSEYRAQYNKPEQRGFIDVIADWDDETWKLFFSRITWLFCAEDETACESQVIEAIKNCPYYRQTHEGKEDVIAGALLDLLDKKQLAADFVDRFVHASDLELLFRRVEQGEIKRVDPTWKAWEKLSPPTDQRNVGEKFLAVCPTLNRPLLGKYQRQTSAGHLELEAHGQDKRVLALRYQIYDACEDVLLALAVKARTLTEEQLSQELERLVQVAVARVNQRAPEYAYDFKNEPFIRSIVLTLFDSCFLSLDGGSHGE